MAITASDVNKLRQQTGAGMMDCKNALVEAGGDFDAAVDILRKKGQKVAAKRGDRDASEGLVIAKTTGSKGIILSLNCETDFVAKNDAFNQFANAIADTALSNSPTSLEELNSTDFNGVPVSEKITEEIGKIGEKIEIADYQLIEAGTVVAYNHPGNQVGSLIGLSKGGNEEVGRDLAMQIAAMAPIAIDKENVSQEAIDRELEIGKEQAVNEGKPAELAEKIAQGKLGKFFKESTLLNQAYIKENKKTVSQYLKEVDGDLKVTAFKRIALS